MSMHTSKKCSILDPPSRTGRVDLACQPHLVASLLRSMFYAAIPEHPKPGEVSNGYYYTISFGGW
jgi:hypothetical protein